MRLRRLLVGTIVSSLAVMVVPQVSTATHCGAYSNPNPLVESGPPVVVIPSGYYGVGGVGAFDSYGCVAGQEVVDSRWLLPQADFVVLVLARPNPTCTVGAMINGSLSGLGVNAATVPMRCGADLRGRKSFVSDIYPLDKTKTGTIIGSASFGGSSYSGRARTLP